jgi:hypothetical protein
MLEMLLSVTMSFHSTAGSRCLRAVKCFMSPTALLLAGHQPGGPQTLGAVSETASAASMAFVPKAATLMLIQQQAEDSPRVRADR